MLASVALAGLDRAPDMCRMPESRWNGAYALGTRSGARSRTGVVITERWSWPTRGGGRPPKPVDTKGARNCGDYLVEN